MSKYQVQIYEQPFGYHIEANSKGEAETRATNIHTHDYADILKVKVTKIKETKSHKKL
jgi:hypothetical protein